VRSLLVLAGASALLTSGASVGAAAAPSFTSAIASIRAVPTAGAADQTGDVALPPRFDDSVTASSVSGGSSDDVTVDQSSTLRGGAIFFAGIISDASLAASADDGGTVMDPLGESRFTVEFTTDVPTTLVAEGLLRARASGAAPTCSQASLAVIPGPTFEAADGPACSGDSRKLVDQAIHLDPGSYTIRLALSTHVFANQSAGFAHAQGSGSWDVDIVLCTNEFTAGHDEIHGTSGSDVLCGGGGADIITGGGGTDTIKGGGGNDTLRGGSDADDIWGGDGNDIVDGGPGDVLDRLYGGAGGDRVLGGDGDDRLYGASVFDGSGDLGDRIEAGGGNDRVIGDRGGDVIEGEGGADLIVGGRDGDTIRAGPGADIVRGEGGNDELVGNGGEDRLDGGRSNDFANACDDGVRDIVIGGPGPRDKARADRVDLVFGSTERGERCGAGRRRS
jgi:Ca2+-binding RTX toxin-like protein